MNDLSSEARALLEATRTGDDPTLEDRQRVGRALAVGTGVAIGSASVSASATTAKAAGVSAATLTAAGGVGKVVAWAGFGIAAGLVSAGALVAASEPNKPAARETVSVASVRAVQAPPVAEPVVPAKTDEDFPNPGETAPPLRALPTASKAAPHAVPPSSLATETALLEKARAALGQGDARRALALLDEHEREFPNGALTEERLASKVFALCGVGRRADAAAAAASLFRRAPSTPLRARVLDSCAFKP